MSRTKNAVISFWKSAMCIDSRALAARGSSLIARHAHGWANIRLTKQKRVTGAVSGTASLVHRLLSCIPMGERSRPDGNWRAPSGKASFRAFFLSVAMRPRRWLPSDMRMDKNSRGSNLRGRVLINPLILRVVVRLYIENWIRLKN